EIDGHQCSGLTHNWGAARRLLGQLRHASPGTSKMNSRAEGRTLDQSGDGGAFCEEVGTEAELSDRGPQPAQTHHKRERRRGECTYQGFDTCCSYRDLNVVADCFKDGLSDSGRSDAFPEIVRRGPVTFVDAPDVT